VTEVESAVTVFKAIPPFAALMVPRFTDPPPPAPTNKETARLPPPGLTAFKSEFASPANPVPPVPPTTVSFSVSKPLVDPLKALVREVVAPFPPDAPPYKPPSAIPVTVTAPPALLVPDALMDAVPPFPEAFAPEPPPPPIALA